MFAAAAALPMTRSLVACSCIAIGHYANRILSDGSAQCSGGHDATLALRSPLPRPADEGGRREPADGRRHRTLSALPERDLIWNDGWELGGEDRGST